MSRNRVFGQFFIAEMPGEFAKYHFAAYLVLAQYRYKPKIFTKLKNAIIIYVRRTTSKITNNPVWHLTGYCQCAELLLRHISKFK